MAAQHLTGSAAWHRDEKLNAAGQDTVHVAVGVIERVVQSGLREILISKRAVDVHQGNLWEFPGGKVESGESVVSALARELHEELGITLDPCSDTLSPLIQIHHDYGDKRVLLDVFIVRAFSGVPHGREGQPVSWVGTNELTNYEFPAANKPIVTACQLPDRIAITPACASLSEVRNALRQFHELGVSHVILRQPTWSSEQYLSWASLLLSEYEKQDIVIMLHGDPRQLSDIHGAHIHMPAALAFEFTSLKPFPGVRFSMSCHNHAELAHAAMIGVEFVTLSPVFETASHPEASPMGWERFSQLVCGTNIPVYALGGMSDADVASAQQHGAQGIAAISAWVPNANQANKT